VPSRAPATRKAAGLPSGTHTHTKDPAAALPNTKASRKGDYKTRPAGAGRSFRLGNKLSTRELGVIADSRRIQARAGPGRAPLHQARPPPLHQPHLSGNVRCIASRSGWYDVPGSRTFILRRGIAQVGGGPPLIPGLLGSRFWCCGIEPDIGGAACQRLLLLLSRDAHSSWSGMIHSLVSRHMRFADEWCCDVGVIVRALVGEGVQAGAFHPAPALYEIGCAIRVRRAAFCAA